MNKKQDIVNNHRDQQFQIHTLVEYSSESSSRKDQQNQIKYSDASDQEKCSKKSIKSLEDISSPETQREDKNGQGNNSKYSQFDRQDKIKKFQLKTVDDSQLQYQTQITKNRRKRQQIFNNLRKPNQQKKNAQEDPLKKSKKIQNRVAFQKKRENHTALKHWNYCRIRIVEFHRAVAEELVKNLDINVRLSLENLEVYKNFFIQRYKQEEIYANTIFGDSDRYLDNDEALDQNSHSSRIYMGCSSMLQSTRRKIHKQKQISTTLSKLLQQKILKQIFQTYYDKIHKESLSLRNKITQLKQSLQKVDAALCEKLVELETIFTECCQDVDAGAVGDFYQVEGEFLGICQQEVGMERKFGLQILEYYWYVVSEEEIRKQMIQKSLKIYSEGFRQYQQDLNQLSKYKSKPKPKDEPTQSPTKPILPQPTSQIQSLYSIQTLLSPQSLQKLSQINPIPQPTNPTQPIPFSQPKPTQFPQLPNFHTFFTKFEVQEFDSHHLIMRKFQVEVFKQVKWVPGHVVISVDKFVHVFVDGGCGSGVYLKPDMTVRVNFVSLELVNGQIGEELDSDDELEIRITTKKQQTKFQMIKSLIKTTEKQEQTVRFLKLNDLLQFQDYLTDLST